MAIGLVLIFAIICYGWGRLAGWLCYRDARPPSVFIVALGLAALNLLGGALNAMHLAFPAALHAVCAMGVALALAFLGVAVRSQGGSEPFWKTLAGRVSQSWAPGQRLANWLPMMVVSLLPAFYAWALLPSGALNVHDDFHTYLVRPIRMLASGSVGGNAFDPLGLDSLGTQSFFQAFFLLWLPAHYANGFDAVFCQGLCAFLILALARRLKLHWGLGLLAVLAFAVINPQYVNISPLYSGSLMIAGLLWAGWLLAESMESSAGKISWREVMPCALFYGALIGLKVTLAIFAGLQFLLFFGFLAALAPRRRSVLMTAMITGLVIGIIVLPWLKVCAPTYLKASQLATTYPAQAAMAAKYPSLAAHGIPNLFTLRELFYGGNLLYYHMLVLLILAAGVMAGVALIRSQSAAGKARLTVLASICFPVMALWILNAHLFDLNTAVRYSCPIIIGVLPPAALFCAEWLAKRRRVAGSQGPFPPAWKLGASVVPLALLAVILFFLPICMARLDRVIRARTLLSFSIDQTYMNYNGYAFGRDEGIRARQMQDRVEPGKTILAWTAQPYLLDFERNQIFTASEPGIINPGLSFPAGISEDGLRGYLCAWGIRYVMLETKGYAIKTISDLEPLLRSKAPVYRKLADYNIYFRRSLLALSKRSRVVFRDERLTLFDLAAEEIPAMNPSMSKVGD